MRVAPKLSYTEIVEAPPRKSGIEPEAAFPSVLHAKESRKVMDFKPFAICLLIVASLSPVDSHAVVKNSKSYYFFDENENLIGQNLLYCNNNTQHIGNASRNNTRTISVTYSCETSDPTAVGYSGLISASLKNDFCAVYQVCGDPGPWPISAEFLNYPLESGLYSD